VEPTHIAPQIGVARWSPAGQGSDAAPRDTATAAVAMDICPDCGNSDMHVRVHEGAAVHECGLCGARFGARHAVDALADAEEAVRRGLPPEVWPLVRALEHLPGLVVRAAVADDEVQRTLPFVELAVADARALVQLENLAKSLLLGAGALRCHWVLEVEYRRHLAFVLKPRHGGGPVRPEQIRDAHVDLDVLRCHLERDVKLQWWRHGESGSRG
jgi:hypothetical protein